VRIAASGRLHAREEGLHLFVEHAKLERHRVCGHEAGG
jgi:hypothetical protein